MGCDKDSPLWCNVCTQAEKTVLCGAMCAHRQRRQSFVVQCVRTGREGSPLWCNVFAQVEKTVLCGAMCAHSLVGCVV